MFNVENLKFDEKGLIPAVVVDHYTKEVLTLAYMNRESLAVTFEKGLTCFYSRSRRKLWLKGESSGNFQHVVSVVADCDGDALVVEVVKDGPACHTGEESCFHNPVWVSDSLKQFSYEGLYKLIEGRKTRGFLHHLSFRQRHRQDPEKSGRGVHRSHCRRQRRQPRRDRLRDLRPHLPSHRSHGRHGHHPRRRCERAGEAACGGHQGQTRNHALTLSFGELLCQRHPLCGARTV